MWRLRAILNYDNMPFIAGIVFEWKILNELKTESQKMSTPCINKYCGVPKVQSFIIFIFLWTFDKNLGLSAEWW